MKVYAAYRITGHGQPPYPEFLFRTKHVMLRYLTELNPRKDWEKYTIKEYNLDIPKMSASQREIEKQELVAGNIKEASVILKTKDGLLHKFSGKEAIAAMKNL